MGESISGSDLFNELAHEFAERYRRGERPSLNEYTDRYPELAEEIRELFPALVMMEQLGSGVDQRAGQAAGGVQRDGPTPERLGDYRILREIGRGGMGIVYEAVQESLGRHVALKVLSHHRQLGPIQLIRFEREAKAAALLHHTNIVPVFGVGEHEGVHYYAMQYIRGQSLDIVLREIVRHRLHASQGRIGSDSKSDGMSASLAARLLTRRLAAEPLPDEATKVVSPPVAQPGEPQNAVPPSTHAEGLPVDEPPSSSSNLGPREARYYRNVARLGVQVAEALAYAHGHGILHRDIKPANLLVDLQGTIWVTDFGLAKAEGTAELTSPGDVVGTLRYLAPERFQGAADPRSDVYSLGLTLYEMLTLKPAFTASHRVQLIHTILHDEPARPRKHVPQIPRDLETIVLKSIAKNPFDRFSTAAEMARDLGRFVAGHPIHCRRVLLPERLWRWSQRNPTLALLILLAATLTSLLAIGSTAAAWKFREQRDVVQIEENKTRANLERALLAERNGREELGRSLLLQARALRYSRQPGRRSDALQSLRTAAQIAHEVGAPSEHLAELRDEVIATLALTDDQPVRTWKGLNLIPGPTACCIDADRYVVLGRNGSIHVYRLSDRSKVRVVGSDRPSARSWLRLVAGGRFVSVESGSSQTELWDLERGEVPAAWPADVRCVAPRLDGRQVAALRSDGELRVYDLPALTEASRCRLGVAVPRRLAYPWMSLSEDGHRLALIRPDQTRACVYEVARGRVVRELKLPSTPPVEALALSRNGRVVAIVQDRSISVYDVVDGEQLALLQGHHSEGITAQFQPGGDLLVSQSWDGTTRLWDPLRGRLLLTLWGPFLDWAGRGSSLAIGRDRNLILHQIAAGDVRRTIDCRMLDDRAGRALSAPMRVGYSPDGQLIVIPMRPGVLIVRASDGVALAHLPIGPGDQALFQPGGTLLTFNETGLCRWPVRCLEGGTLRMGPPEPLALPDQGSGFVFRGLATSASGRLVGAASQRQPGSVLLDPGRPWRRTWLTPHQGAPDLAISPNGRWTATAGRGPSPDNRQVNVWDAATGQLLVQLPVGNAKVAFSPDSQWLGVGGESRYRFFRTGSWTPGPAIDHGVETGISPLAFHPGSRIAATRESYGSWLQYRSRVRLIEVETGRVLASLEAPEDSTMYGLVFSPDGRFLATSQTDRRVDVWDLSAIRRRLEEVDLAQGLPDLFRGSTPSGDAPAVDRIEVVGADPAALRLLAVRQTLRRAWFAIRALLDPGLADAEELLMRGRHWDRLGRWRMAAADYRASLARRPGSAVTANELAWCLVAMPGRGDADEAVRWARQAVALAPDDANSRNTLGVALYRASRFAEAGVELERNIPRNARSAGYDWVFLAMCRQRLGQAAPARAALANAVRWRAERIALSPAEAAEFHVFLHEAESILDGPLADLPSHVFAR